MISECFIEIVDIVDRSCIVGPNLEVRVCTLGTVINRSAYPSDYCQLEGTGRQSQPMPIRWMSWESILLVSNFMDRNCGDSIFKTEYGAMNEFGSLRN